jgi:hypothetical protein
MPLSIDDQVLNFYNDLFDAIFSEPFRECIAQRRRRQEVIRQIEAAADAASSSLTRFFSNQKLSEQTVECILQGFQQMGDLLKLESISNANVTTEEVAENLLGGLPCPDNVPHPHDTVYRLALYTVVQVLMQVGPVMAEWQKLNFSSTFEIPRKVVNRLNDISNQVNALGTSGSNEADKGYEILYRDYLMQRFHKVEAGTVRMTTNLNVDLRELFVMPHVLKQLGNQIGELDDDETPDLMNLAEARKRYLNLSNTAPRFINARDFDKAEVEPQLEDAFEHVKQLPRMVMIGLPGAGKSTFFEWLQVQLASVGEQLVLSGKQAIPLMIRVRQLDLHNLPKGNCSTGS